MDGALGAIVVEESTQENGINITFSFPYFTEGVFYDPVQSDAESGSIGDDSVAEDIAKVLQGVAGEVESLVTGARHIIITMPPHHAHNIFNAAYILILRLVL